uniref:Uncharacterized protein n=1 Tax=Geobacter metallireducens TaxID=28232 RepID=A0A831XDN0_GEOME
MAKDVRFLISASAAKAEDEIRRLQRTGQQTASILQREFDQLGMTSTIAFEAKRKAAESAYNRIKTSGMATQDELARAEKALADKLVQIDTEQFGRRTGLVEKFKANWLAAAAAIGAAWVAISQGWDLAMQAAEGMQQRQSFANLAASHGFAADQIVESLQRVSGETIATKELIEKAGTAMLLGIPADKLSRLMEIARASSRVTGQSVSKSFDDIALAVGRGSKMILDNLGIIVQEERAYKEYAATLGKSADQLTDAEKKQAFMNATLAAGDEIIKRVGVTAETAAEKMQRFEARVKNLRETVGRGLLAALTAVYGVVNLTAAATLYLSGAIFKVIEGVNWMLGRKAAMDEWRLNAEAAFAAAKDLKDKGLGDLGAVADILTGRITAFAGAMQKMAATTSDAATDIATDIATYSKEVDKLGALQLKAAASGYSEDLKRQADLLKENGRLARDLSAPLERYLAVIDQVYSVQLDAQRQIGQALFRVGAEQMAIAQQNITIATTEKAATDARLQAWSQYLDNLRAMHASAMGEMKKAQDELFSIRLTTGDLVAQVQQKMMSPMEQYYAQVQRLEEKQRIAQGLGADEKIRMLQGVQQAWANLTSEVKDGDQIFISQAEASAFALTKIKAIGSEMEAEKAAQIGRAGAAVASLQQAMTAADGMISEYQQRLAELDARIAALTRTFSLSMKDEASPVIAQAKSALDSIQDKTVTITAVYRNVYADSPAALGSYAVGTSYVPRTGLYQLHQGEQVSTRTEASRERSGGLSLTLQGGINITLPNVVRADAASADDLARAVWPKLEEFARRKMGNR